jgi:hypothetical protein
LEKRQQGAASNMATGNSTTKDSETAQYHATDSVIRRCINEVIHLGKKEKGYSTSSAVRLARRIAFCFFIRFLMEGFVKKVLFLNSFNTPERSYFFLNRFIARSIGSFS